MCGIVGIFFSYSSKKEDVFTDMMKMATVRGMDSSGAAFIKQHSEEQTYIKAAFLAHYLLSDKEFKENLNKNTTGLLGHCRWATRGKVTDDNAHPFQHEHITLVHNGSASVMNLEWNKFETDSEGICFNIANIGIELAWKEIIGAAALAWWDNKTKSLNLIRNADRPMWFGRLKGDGIIFASEPWMAQAALARRGMELEGTMLSIEPNYLWTFRSEKTKVVESTKKLEERPPFQPSKGVTRLPLGNHYQRTSTKSGTSGTAQLYKLDPNVPDIENRFNSQLSGLKINHLDKKSLSFPEGRDKATKNLFKTFKEESQKLAKNSLMSEKQFNDTFKDCCHCGNSLFGSQDTAIQIDARKAVCLECATTAAENDMSLAF